MGQPLTLDAHRNIRRHAIQDGQELARLAKESSEPRVLKSCTTLLDQDEKGLTVHSTYERHESIREMGGLVRLGQVLRFARMGVFCPGSGRRGRPG